MKNWKLKTASAVLTLSLLVPTAAFADGAANANGERPNPRGFAQHQAFKGENQQTFESQLLELVSKYQPESLEEWKEALAAQNELREQSNNVRPADGQRPEVSDELKEKIEAIQQDLKNGEITPEEAKEEMENLGLQPRPQGQPDNLMAQLKQAVEDDDQTEIKELLSKMLEQLQEKNEFLSNAN